MFWIDQTDTLVTVNGWNIYGSDIYGCQWFTSAQYLEGVFDGSGSNISTSQKIWSDGSYSNVPRRSGRDFAITGFIQAGCLESVLQSWEQFKAKILVSDEFVVRVVVGSWNRWCYAMQASSAPLFECVGRNLYKFQVSFVCLSSGWFSSSRLSGSTFLPSSEGGWWLDTEFDPYDGESPEPVGDNASWFEFSESVVTGAISFTNPGTISSPVLLRIYGDCVNPRVEHSPSGRVMSFVYSLPSSRYIECDGETHDILLNGGTNFLTVGSMGSMQWATAEPGENIWRFNAESGSETARLYVSFYPMYV